MREWVVYLLELEDVLVEVVLESLVGEVDAELFKAVVLVVLKAKDVQHTDGQYLEKTQVVFNFWFFQDRFALYQMEQFVMYLMCMGLNFNKIQ